MQIMTDKRIGVTGASGRIGRELIALGCVPIDVDILDESAVKKVLDDLKPHVIIHCAGKSDPDECERDYKSAYRVNVSGFANVVWSSKAPVILISTDHVFDGKKGNYKENDTPNLKKMSVYAVSKFGAEVVARSHKDSCRVIRISSTFPNSITDVSEGFMVPATFLCRSYAYRKHIAEGIYFVASMIADCGIESVPFRLHIAGKDILSEYDFALMWASIFGFDKSKIQPRSAEFTTLDFAPRPHKLGLNVNAAKKLGVPLYSALDGLTQMKKDLGM